MARVTVISGVTIIMETKETPTPAPGGIDRPAVVVNFVNPYVVVNAADVLAAFQDEVYPAVGTEDTPAMFRVQFSHWKPFGMVAAMVFPHDGIGRLAQLCAANGLVLVRGVLTAINPETREHIALSTAIVTSGISAVVPDDKDVYTFWARTDPATPLIICGAHAWDLPPELREASCGCGGTGPSPEPSPEPERDPRR